MKHAPVTARLLNPTGAALGFCDVAWQVDSSGQLLEPALPEVISLQDRWPDLPARSGPGAGGHPWFHRLLCGT